MQANAIDAVIDRLDTIVEYSKKEGDTAGYFAALYRKVTKRVRKGIIAATFEDSSRMEILAVLFAQRYLDAYDKFYSNKPLSKSWQIAFNKTRTYRPIVLQHLLWGINAHINLDLGIAVAVVAKQVPLEDLKKDFNKINALLAELVEDLQKELSQILPSLKYVLMISGKLDNFLIDFSMKKARDGAWIFANELYLAKQSDWEEMILVRDNKIAVIASYINPSGFVPNVVLALIRRKESGSVKKKIEILS